LDTKDNLLVSGSDGGLINCWDIRELKCIEQLTGHQNSVNTVLLRDNYIISASNDATIRIWDRRNSENDGVMVLQGHRGWVSAIATHVNPVDGSMNIVSAGEDGTVKVWSLATSECLYTLAGEQRQLLSLSVDDTRIIATSWNHIACLYDFNVPTTTPLFSLPPQAIPLSIRSADEVWLPSRRRKQTEKKKSATGPPSIRHLTKEKIETSKDEDAKNE